MTARLSVLPTATGSSRARPTAPAASCPAGPPPPKSKAPPAGRPPDAGGWAPPRLYRFGLSDPWAWAHPVVAALGWWGVERVRRYGQDDQLAWLLIPLLGF